MLPHPAFSGVPNAKRGGEIRSGYLRPAFSGAKRGWKCYVTPAFSGVPNAKCGEKIRSCYLTAALRGAQKRAEMLRTPYILGRPQRQAQEQNRKWPTGGRIAYTHAFFGKFVFFLCGRVV